MNLPVALEQLIAELAKMPGIGKKTAKRLAFSLLQKPEKDSIALAEAIVKAKQRIKHCNHCFGFSEADLCSICSSGRRDQEIICAVEDPRNIYTIENAGIFDGVYHVLQGAISPLQGISPDRLRIRELEERIATGKIRELIIATNPTIEGEATAHYLTDLLINRVESITRIARGIPSGSDMEYADSTTLSRAFEGRTSYSKF